MNIYWETIYLMNKKYQCSVKRLTTNFMKFWKYLVTSHLTYHDRGNSQMWRIWSQAWWMTFSLLVTKFSLGLQFTKYDIFTFHSSNDMTKLNAAQPDRCIFHLLGMRNVLLSHFVLFYRGFGSTARNLWGGASRDHATDFVCPFITN